VGEAASHLFKGEGGFKGQPALFMKVRRESVQTRSETGVKG
jgi:hypothetical protein